MTDQVSPEWWPDDERDNEPRHACWEICLPDGTWQKAASWPPMTKAEILAAYKCTEAIADK